jgi:hypothetical protein
MTVLKILWRVISTLVTIAWRLSVLMLLLTGAVVMVGLRIARSASPRPGDAASWSPRF